MAPPRRSFLLALAAAATVFAWAYPRVGVAVRTAAAPERAAAMALPTLARPVLNATQQQALAEIVRKRETAERLLNGLAPVAPQWMLSGDELTIEIDAGEWRKLSVEDRDAWMKSIATDPSLQDFGCHVVDFYVGDRRIQRTHL